MRRQSVSVRSRDHPPDHQSRQKEKVYKEKNETKEKKREGKAATKRGFHELAHPSWSGWFLSTDERERADLFRIIFLYKTLPACLPAFQIVESSPRPLPPCLAVPGD